MKLCQSRIPRGSRACVHAALAVIALVVMLSMPAVVAAGPSGADTKEPTAKTEPAKADPAKKTDVKATSKFEQEKLDLPTAQDKKDADKAAKKKDAASGGAIWRMILGLLFVLGVIYAVHWMLKKYSKSRFPGMVSSGNGAIEVVATTPLAQGRSLHLVKVGGEVVLIGATEQSITQLRTLDAQQMSDDAGNAGNSEFQQMLQGAMGSGTVAPGYSGTSTSSTLAGQDTFFRRFIGNLQMITSR